MHTRSLSPPLSLCLHGVKKRKIQQHNDCAAGGWCPPARGLTWCLDQRSTLSDPRYLCGTRALFCFDRRRCVACGTSHHQPPAKAQQNVCSRRGARPPCLGRMVKVLGLLFALAFSETAVLGSLGVLWIEGRFFFFFFFFFFLLQCLRLFSSALGLAVG